MKCEVLGEVAGVVSVDHLRCWVKRECAGVLASGARGSEVRVMGAAQPENRSRRTDPAGSTSCGRRSARTSEGRGKNRHAARGMCLTRNPVDRLGDSAYSNLHRTSRAVWRGSVHSVILTTDL